MNKYVDINVCGVQNLVPCTYKTEVLKPNVIDDKNILTQSMINKPNTKYVIKYDFLLSDAIVEKTVNVISTNVSQCGNAGYADALAAYNLAHDAWIDADNAYTNNPNDTTLAAKNAAYAALEAAQLTLNGIPQYYYFAGSAINIKKGQHVTIPEGCVLLNDTRTGVVSFDIAPNDMTVYIGSATTGNYNYKIQGGIEMLANCLIEFDGGSISDGVLIGDETILIFDQKEEVVLKNVELLGDFERSSAGAGDKKDNTNGMAKIYLKKNKSFASQLTQPNTIYVIQYDFTLDEDITVPENCVLEFDGGSITGGSYGITCNKTIIFSTVDKIFRDVIISGTIVGDLELNHFENTNNCTTSAVNLKVGIYVKGSITVDAPIVLSSNMRLYGDTDKTTITLDSNYVGDISCVVKIDGTQNVIIENLSFANADYAIYRNSQSSLMNSKIDGIKITSSIRVSAIYIHSSFGSNIIRNLVFNDVELSGSIIHIDGTWINNNRLEHSSFVGRCHNALYLSSSGQFDNFFISDCWFELLFVDIPAVSFNGTNTSYSITNIKVSKCWIERIFASTEYDKYVNNIVPTADLIRKDFISFDINFSSENNNKINLISFENNTFSAWIESVVNFNSKRAVCMFENNNIAPVGADSKPIHKIIAGGDESYTKIIAINNEDFNLSSSEVSNNVYDLINSISGVNSISRKLNHTIYQNFTIDRNETKIINLVPSDLINKSVWWSDIHIMSSDLKITTGKIIYIYTFTPRQYKFVKIFSDDDNLTINAVQDGSGNYDGTVEITNTAQTIREFWIGALALTQ